MSVCAEPIITWYYNNQVIKPSKYFQMLSRDGVHQLTIAGAFPEDDGQYKCVARNQAGEVTCIAHLKVNRKSYNQHQTCTLISYNLTYQSVNFIMDLKWIVLPVSALTSEPETELTKVMEPPR